MKTTHLLKKSIFTTACYECDNFLTYLEVVIVVCYVFGKPSKKIDFL